MDETANQPIGSEAGQPEDSAPASAGSKPFQLTDAHVLEMKTRVLYPVTFNLSKKDPLKKLKDKLEQDRLKVKSSGGTDTKPREFVLWEESEHIANSLYTEEATPPVVHLLFVGAKDDQHLSGQYLRLPDRTHSYLFRNHLSLVSTQKGKPFTSASSIRMEVKIEEVELFLSGLGVGVLSITVVPLEPLDVSAAKSLNYWLSQQGKKKREARLYLPHPEKPYSGQDISSGAPPVAASVVPAATDEHALNQVHGGVPTDAAPFEERAGLPGGWFTLTELKDLLLRSIPRAESGERDLQEQFSVYTSIRFGPAVRFSREDCRRVLAPLLAGLAQVEESTHPGAASLEELGVEAALLNAQHWAAVGSLGAAHLVSDDDTTTAGFNTQRTGHIQKKYFTSFLLAYLQSNFLGLLERSAAEKVRCTGYPQDQASVKEWADAFPTLRRRLLTFDLLAAVRFASQREAHNRAYQLAQRGLGVQRAFGDITRAISEMEASCGVWQQAQNIAHLVVMQRKVEIVEVFLISIYSIYFFHFAGDHFFQGKYVGGSTVVGPVLVAFLAYHYLVRKVDSDHHDSHSMTRDPGAVPSKNLLLRRLFPPALVCWIIGIMVAYLGVGYCFYLQPESLSADTDHRSESSRATDTHPPGPAATPKLTATATAIPDGTRPNESVSPTAAPSPHD